MLIHVACWCSIMHSHIRLQNISFKAFFVISPNVIIILSMHSDQRHFSTSKQLSSAVSACLALTNGVVPGNQ